MADEILIDEKPVEEIIEKPIEKTTITVFSAAEVIKDVERKYYITSITIDMDKQTCTVKRKSVLSWGDPLVALSTSTSYDEVVLTGKEFVVAVGESYNTLSNSLYEYMTNKGI